MLPALVLWALCAGEPPESESYKVYAGRDGQRVEVVTLKPRAQGKAVVRVSGADSLHDGLVLPCQVGSSSQGLTFTTRYGGADWVVLDVRDGKASASLPDRPSFSARFESAEADKAAAVLEALKAQELSGQFKLFARKAWPVLEKKYQQKADAAVKALSAPCGKAMHLGFDWSSFDDAVMGEVDVWAMCGPLVARLSRSCGLAGGAAELRCKSGPAFAVSVEQGVLTFTSVAPGKGASEFLGEQR